MKKIFVSSTFRDMHFERDAINNIIMPKLSKMAKEYGEDVYFVDLRWGIDTADLSDVNFDIIELNSDNIENIKEIKSNIKVLNSCMSAIDECDYFLVLLGDRYGTKFDLEQLYKEVLLNNCIDSTSKSDVSVTEFEIDYGPLNINHQELLKKTIFMFRDTLIDAPCYFYANGENEEEKNINKIKIEQLKDKIITRVTEMGGTIINYSLKWNNENNCIEPNDEFIESLINAFSLLFDDEKKKWDNLSFREKEKILVEAHIANNANKLIGRKDLVEKVFNDIGKQQLIYLLGDTHSGKTVLISSIIEKCRKNGIKVAPMFYGITNSSMNDIDYYRQWTEYIVEFLGDNVKKEFLYFNVNSYEEQINPKYKYHVELNFENSSKNLDCYFYYRDKFYEYLDLFDNKNIGKLLLVIDSNNVLNIDPDFYIKKYKNITILVGSWYDGERNKNRKPKIYYLDDYPLSHDDVITSRLLQLNKHLNNDVKNEIKKKNFENIPFYLTLAVLRLMIMDESDFNINQENSEDIIKCAQLEIIRKFPTTLEEMFIEIIEEVADRFGREQIINIVILLSISTLKLSKQDIKNILYPITLNWKDNVLDRFIYSLSLLFDFDVEGKIKFSEPTLKNVIKEKYTNNEILKSSINYFENNLTIDQNSWQDAISYRLYSVEKFISIDYEQAMNNLDNALDLWIDALNGFNVYTYDNYLDFGKQIFNTYGQIWSSKKDYELSRVIYLFNAYNKIKEQLGNKTYMANGYRYSIDELYFIFYEIIFDIICYRVYKNKQKFNDDDGKLFKQYYLEDFDKIYLKNKKYKIEKDNKLQFYLLCKFYNKQYNKKEYYLREFKKDLIYFAIILIIIIVGSFISYFFNYK